MASSALPEKMLAAQVVEFNKPYHINTIPVPKLLDEHDLLVKVAVASLCHTDSMVTSGVFKSKLPLVGSHEGAGTVVALGSSAQGFQPGDRILCGVIYHRCGICPDCQGPEQQQHYCAQESHLGILKDGSFAEYQIVDSREACRLPDNLSFQSAAPLACAGRTIWGGLARADLKAGESVAIVGAGGGLGHLGVQFAKALGLVVIALDARDEALQLAQECGADVLVDARQEKAKVVEEVMKVTGGRGADATLNLADHPSAAATSAAITKMHATVVQIAQPDEVVVPFHEFVFRDIKFHGSLLCSAGEAQKMLELVAKHDVKVKTNPFRGLKELPQAVELAHSGKMQGKPAILIDEEAIAQEKKSGLKMV
ncbi:putative alcohol dehydrogenase-3 [Coleophoma crateriformis]|uniref:Putative alcohol dehydrogenase-3 n=1 Tax=Coleophoma crateriformis TaxID=565419 RepID=A0A3D8R397_9HELO|nr:putative alcohol dehydrogenase-3 [Coleophoma crateriformis]